jgi:hypothetical protein
MYKLKITILFSCMILISIIPSVSNATPYNQIVSDVKNRLGVSDKVAKAFIKYVHHFIGDIQKNFTNIASHNTSVYNKDYLVNKTIQKYFKHPIESEVQVSSIKSTRIRTYSIKTYLRRLSEYSLKYKTVKVYYDKSYLSMGPVNPYYQNGKKHFEFKVSLWQMFEGCQYDQNGCYKDYTKKGFHLIFIQNSNWEMKVDTITADKTVSSYSGRGDWNLEDIFQ